MFGPVAADADSLASLLKHVFTRPVGKVELSHLAAGDADIVCRAAYRHGCRVRTTTIQRSPFVPQGRSFEDYVQRRDRRRVRALGRNRERLQAAGDVTFTVHQDQDDLGDAVEQFFELEQCGWKSDAGTAILSDPATAQFYRAATRWAAEAGMLRVALLRVDGTPVAGELCIKDHRAVHALKAGYDPAFRRYTPGLLVQFDMIERALGAGLGYEFLGSAEPYKLNWADDVHDIDRLDVYPSTFAGSRAQLAELGVRAARRGVAVVGHAGAEAARRIRARQRQAVPSG
ncbi:MAG: hypothetical protein ABS81_11510 [Pseudonocardia sp. SCN 72-86]|nr:MAG: hypothetical protein ABS81_11510 [Pseudonocardia sp. SCN 72-86]